MAKKTFEQKFDKWITKNKHFPTLKPDTGPIKRWEKWLGADVDLPGFDDSEPPAAVNHGLTGLSGLSAMPGVGVPGVWD